MISIQILQSIVSSFKNITGYDLTIINKNAELIVSTELNIINKFVNVIYNFVLSSTEEQTFKGYNYFKVFNDNIIEYIVIVKGEDKESHRISQLVSFQLDTLINVYKKRYEKDNFIKNLLLDNLMSADIYIISKKLNIASKKFRTVYLIEALDNKYTIVYEKLKEINIIDIEDFIIYVSEKNIVIIKELEDNYNIEKIENIANEIYKILLKELNIKVYISIGNIIDDIKDISLSYKEAKIALEILKIFYSDKYIINSNNLSIYRLICQIPTYICKTFLNEVLNEYDIESMDDEILDTINRFFENNLNISETSRKLYIHRNTLVYRLDKLERITGLDIRIFDNAVIFKIILIVSKYINYKERIMY